MFRKHKYKENGSSFKCPNPEDLLGAVRKVVARGGKMRVVARKY